MKFDMNKKEFELEKNHLKRTYIDLQILINDEKDKTSLPDYLKIDSVTNRDEIATIMNYQQDFYFNLGYIYDRINQLNELQSEVYFARLDLKSLDGEITSYYISKQGLSKINTVDWRSDIGALFYDVTNTVYDGKDVCLKRRFEIRNDVLEKYTDTFVSKESSSSFTDGFLIEILLKKKDEPKITNIIRTIQDEQNKIIRSKESDNFVVLGCAGSGKTMILLHRLSFLKYQNLSKHLNAKIITPNHDFKNSFEKLQHELELNEVEMLTLDEYYRYLLLNAGYKIEEKVKMLNEYDLNGDMLNNIYSSNIMSLLFDKYKSNLDKIYQTVYNDNDITELEKYRRIMQFSSDSKKNRLYTIIREKIRNIKKEAVLPLIGDIIKFNKVFLFDWKNRKIQEAIKNIEEDPSLHLEKEIQMLEDINIDANKVIEGTNDVNNYFNDKIKVRQKNIDEIDVELLCLKEIEEKKKKLEEIISELTQEIDIIKFNIIRKKALVRKKNRFLGEYNIINEQYSNKIHNKNNLYIAKKDIELEIKQLLEEKKRALLILNSIINNKSFNNLKDATIIANDLCDDLNELVLMEQASILRLLPWYDNVFIDEIINPMLVDNKYKPITKKEKYNFYYMYLLYLITTYENTIKENNKIVCIDEFQDLSPLEIELIAEVNNTTSLNLYGDLGQRLLSKGVTDEKYLENKFTIYTLNNNYRNTNQITEFYNQRLGKNDNKVGVDGPLVGETSMDKLKKLPPNDKKVFICSRKEKNKFKKVVQIKVLSVEETKGLEFNSVYVYDKNMTENEKYIAYSRALFILFIVTD